MTGFIRPRPVDGPAVRVVAFHHAGGSAVTYFPLMRGLPADWDLVLLDLPGRGRSHRLPALTDMTAVVDVATRDVLPWTDAPLALFGHSLGALVAAEVARRVQSVCAPPVWVGVSGRPGPRWPAVSRLSADLSDADLMDELSEAGGMPDRIDDLPEFREQFLRLLRDDLRAVESYLPDSRRAPLVSPLTAFSGQDDHLAPTAAVADWRSETIAEFRHRTFPGGHFYFLGAAFEAMTAAVTDEIRRYVRPTAYAEHG
jgi:surfactin synthase thioesterase subunit